MAPEAKGGGIALPRVTIQYCTKCKWMLRAAYYAQELLSTFSDSIGEVALQPAPSGTFAVSITHEEPQQESGPAGADDGTASSVCTKQLWDRRADGGFPETKELKRRVRDVIEPRRDLGHVDRHGTFGPAATSPSDSSAKPVSEVQGKETVAEKAGGPAPACDPASKDSCEDCQ